MRMHPIVRLGASAFLVASCGSVGPIQSTDVPPIEQSEPLTTTNRLTRQERIRAVAIRTREARRIRPETETLMRTYDRDGKVRGEYVMRGGQMDREGLNTPQHTRG